ncbi:MAG: DAK2 domain-containing protein, partial [Lachnospiraceae bacterium]|nr:DAK2 domain-containing protein [Lachnospiraceae bacterium]
NNKNVILAANQAADLVEDKKVIVIPTKTVPQGITAVINFVPDLSAEENAEVMTAEIGNVKTGEVTYAVRDTQIDDKVIKQGDYMGIGDAGILTVGTDLNEITLGMVDAMVSEDAELISIYYGSDVTEEDAEKIRDAVADKYGDCDVELQCGGQPIYYYVISVE